jgi:hypothetical protein
MSQELIAAIKRHDTVQVRALLAGGADPNEPQSKWPGLRPLQVARWLSTNSPMEAN